MLGAQRDSVPTEERLQKGLKDLNEVFLWLTLKSLICKNSSMIDLHFLSISSSDSEGFSWAGAGGASGLAGRKRRKKIITFRKGKSTSFSEMTF